MKTKALFSALLLVAAALPLPADTPASEAAEGVKATLVAMWDAIEKGDLERYGSYLHPDFTVFGESDPYLAAGKELELRNMSAYLQRAKNVHTEMNQPQVRVRGEVAWITYYWTDSGAVDGKRVSTRGKSTRIFVKEDDKWLCIHGHFTAVP